MYVAAVIIAAGFVLFYCSYQIRLGAYVRTLCRNRAAGLTSALRDHYSKCPIKAIPLEKTATISYGCIYDPNAPMTPFLKDLFGIVAKELGHIPK